MLRETVFEVGGALTIGLGASLAVGLAWAGAGEMYLAAWMASGLAVLFGAFFLYVGREERRNRRDFLAQAERDSPENSGPH